MVTTVNQATRVVQVRQDERARRVSLDTRASPVRAMLVVQVLPARTETTDRQEIQELQVIQANQDTVRNITTIPVSKLKNDYATLSQQWVTCDTETDV